MRDNTFSANVVQANGELLNFNDVVAIRIVSRFYNLLIMKDYMPIIGEINGGLTILGRMSKFEMPKGIAYFVSHDNNFTLIVKEDDGNSKMSMGVDNNVELEEIVENANE